MIRDGRRRRCHAHAGRRPFRKNGKSQDKKRRRRPFFSGDGVVVGRVREGKVDGAEGARSFNELYQLVVTCEQTLGAERARQSRTKGERGTVWVEV